MNSRKVLLVKVGGNIIDDSVMLSRFLCDFSTMEGLKILVHGGGKIATQIAKKLEIPTQMVEGRRITSTEMLKVVTMVYGGLINKNIVTELQTLGINSLGLTGADGAVITAKKRKFSEIDYGWVGDIETINIKFIKLILEQKMIPIFAPLTYSNEEKSLLNTNADTMASEIAKALVPEYELSLIYCLEKNGVLENPNDDNSVLPKLSKKHFLDLKNAGNITTGMIPKLENAFSALEKGVSNVKIIHGSDIKNALEPTIGTVLLI